MVELSSGYNLDQELSASVKKILLKSITFKDAQIPDDGDILSHKYKPLNGRYNLQHGTSSKTNQVSKNSQEQNDLPKPPIMIYPPEKVELGWKEMRRIGPGLANLGNTCFLNSVLQVLTYTPPLVNYMLSGYHKSKCRIVGFCMQCELSAHINRVINNSQGGAIRPMSIIQKLQCIGKNFRFGRQEDAHEFLRYVVEGFQKSDYADKPKLDKLSKETTVANAIFGGFYRSQVKCLHCNYESNTFDPMMDLNMDIKDCSSIIQTFQKSVRPDRLDGENKYFCEKCRTKRVAQKRGNIHKEPNILTLVLKRFDFSKMFGGKISKDVSFTEELNIRPFMSNNQGEPVIYKLYGILVHSGFSCNSGHYYCYVKASNGTWYEMNDSRVCQVGLQTVLRAQAYILFYVKNSQIRKAAKSTHLHAASHGISNSVQKTELKPGSEKELLTNSKDSFGVFVKRKPEPKINWTPNHKETGGRNVTSIPNQKETTVRNIPLQNNPSIANNTGNIPSKGVVAVNTHNIQPSAVKNVVDDNVVGSKAKVNMQIVSSQQLPLTGMQKEGDVQKSSTMNNLQKLSEAYDDSDEVESRASSPSSNSQDESSSEQFKSETNEKEKEKIELAANKVTDDVDKESNMKNELHESKPPFKLTLKTGKQFIHNKLNIWSPITKGTLYPRAILNKCIIDNESDQSKVQLSTKKKKIPDSSSWKEENISTTGRLFGPLMPPPPGSKCQKSNSITSEASSSSSIQNQSGEWDVLDKGCDVSAPIADHPPAGWNVSSTSHSSRNDESQTLTSDIDDCRLMKKKKNKKKKKKKHRSEEMFSGQVELKQKVCISIDKVRTNEALTDAKLENTLTHDSKKKKMQLQSTISLPLIPTSSSEDIYRKKLKKKRKKISLLIDTNTNNIGKLYNIPCEIEKYLSKYEVKSKSDPLSHDNYKSNISSKVVKNYSSNLTESLLSHDEKETILGREDSINPEETTSNQRTSEHTIPKNETDHPITQNGDIHCSNPLLKNNLYMNHRIENNSRLQETKEKLDSHSRSSNNGGDSYSSSERSEGNRTVKSVIKDESSIKKREVPSHAWDDQRKKHFSWDGSNKSDTMEHLLGGGPKVTSWDGSNKSYFYKIKKNAENVQDEWDDEYDRGKEKKKKRKIDDDYDNRKPKSNSFQDFQNYKNHNYKDKSSHRSSKHYSDHRHHSKKRKLYSDSNRFV